MPYQIDELKKAGLGLIGFGISFTFLGVVLFFDKGLLALGNIFWLVGVAILIGWQSMLKLFTSRANYKVAIAGHYFGDIWLFLVVWWILANYEGVSLPDPWCRMDS